MKSIAFMICASTIAIGCGAAPTDTIDETQQAVASRPLYRRVAINGQDYDHFYTTINGEGTAYSPEGILGYCEPQQTSNGNVSTVLLHRLWSDHYTDHFYTTDASEAANATRYGWVDETSYAMPQCWVWPVQVANTCPVYRMWSAYHSDHLYTQSPVEYSARVNDRNIGAYLSENTHAWYMQAGTEVNSQCQ